MQYSMGDHLADNMTHYVSTHGNSKRRYHHCTRLKELGLYFLKTKALGFWYKEEYEKEREDSYHPKSRKQDSRTQ